jgi:pimeloyl-ACP methyl ester carboxylesterase
MNETREEFSPTISKIRANGLAHRVLSWGDENAPTLVCAHGFLDHAWSFHFLAQHLVRMGLRVIAFDWRGHGESEWIGAGGYYYFSDYTLDLTELAPQLTRKPFHLLGHSMGGTACAMWASTRPAQLRSLTLCEGLGPPTSTESAPERLRHWLASVERLRKAPPRPLSDMNDAIKRLRLQHPELDAELARWVAEKSTRTQPDGTLTWCFDPLHRTSSPFPFRAEALCALLACIDVKTLVVTGSHGFRTPDHRDRVAALPDAHETELKGATHMMHWHAHAQLAQCVLEHIRKSESTG